MAITAVGSLQSSATQIQTTGQATLSFTPATIGDIIVVFGSAIGSTSETLNMTSFSGGGVTTWNQVLATVSGIPGSALEGFIDLWYGVVTSTGASTITASQTAPGVSQYYLLNAFEFSAGASGLWSADGSGTTTGTSASTSGNYPSLSPTGSGELYWGGIVTANSTLSGSTSGFTYASGESSGGYSYITYNPSCSNPSAYSPNWSKTGGGGLVLGAMLIKFTPASNLPPRPKGLPAAVRRANNYFKRENGLWEPERGLIVPRVA